MLLETMFMSAIGACVTRRAHPKVDTNSGNSDRKGATHCTRKNWLMPSVAATAIIDSRKGGAVTHSSAGAAALPPEHHDEVQQGRDESHHLYRMLRLELDPRQCLAAAAATRECEDEIDHRPAEAEQEPNRPRQIGDREVRSLGVASRFP